MQINSKWGDGLIKNVSKDLTHEFPDMKGFSVRNLQSICKWYRFYNNVDEKTKQLVSQTSDSFFMIPWGHHPQYALEGYNQPLGISEYALEKLLPNEIKSSLPTIEEIENELKNT